MTEPASKPEDDLPDDELPEDDPHKDQAAWDAIVADLSGQIDLGPEFRPEPAPRELHDDFHGLVDDDFVPPEPPPLRLAADAVTRFAWAAVIFGPLLALVGFVFGWSGLIGSIGIGATIGGFFLLVARRDRHVPPGYDHGDGAVV